MYSTLLITHRIVVTLFLLHYVYKLMLLMLRKNEQLDKYSAMMRIPEMIVSAGFLITGVWMMVQSALFGNMMIVKLICVFAAIPLAVVGFKKKNKMLALLAILLVVAAYGLAEMNKAAKTGGEMDTSAAGSDPIAVGKMVYSNSCVNCHGADGKLSGSGAKDLSMTQLSAEEQKTLIRTGKNAMPAFRKLTNEQVDGVVQYMATLKH